MQNKNPPKEILNLENSEKLKKIIEDTIKHKEHMEQEYKALKERRLKNKKSEI